MLSVMYKSMTLVIFIMVMFVLLMIVFDISFDIRKATKKRRFSKKIRNNKKIY